MGADTKPIAVGDTRTQVLVDDLTRTQIVQYAGASGDYNPLHTDEVFAKEVAGYPTVFAHGMLSMGMTGRLLTDWFGAGSLTHYGVRFVKQVWPGDVLRCTAVVTGKRETGGDKLVDLDLTVVNQNGDKAITGAATAAVG